MNPINAITNAVKKVLASELYALADEIAERFELDKEALYDQCVCPRLDMYNIRRRGGARARDCTSSPSKPLRQTAVIQARHIEYHGLTYLLDTDTGHVYTNDLSNPVHVGEVLADGDVLLYKSSNLPSSSSDKHGHKKHDQHGQQDEQNDEETHKPIEIHLHL